jgi:hypothetical protein
MSLLIAALSLVPAGRLWAQTSYHMQVIARAGGYVDGKWIGGRLFPGALNDNGQILFTAERPNQSQTLFEYTGGQLVPVVAAGHDSPTGQWLPFVRVAQPGSMNQRGSVALSVGQSDTGALKWNSTFRWDATSLSCAPVALEEMPALYNVPFLAGDLGSTPTINNQDEVAFAGYIRDLKGNPRRAFFLSGRNGALLPVALPDQEAHGGEVIQPAGSLSLNDAGLIAFQAQRQGDPDWAFSAYLWEYGSLLPAVRVGSILPDGSKVTRVTAVRLGNQDRVMLVALHVSSRPDQAGLYFALNGQLKPVAVPGQELPGGGKLRGIKETLGSAGFSATFSISRANERGQYAFLAVLEDGSQAVYVTDPDGNLSLVLKTGTTTEVGQIVDINRNGYGLCLNSQGEVAVTVQLAGQPDALVLLTPAESAVKGGAAG